MATSRLAQFRLESVVWRSKVDFVMELTWLSGLVIVPIVFSGRNLLFLFTQPKQEIVHFTALALVCLWVLSIGLSLAQYSGTREFTDDLKRWFRGIRRNPYKLALLAVALYAIGQLLAWAFSPVPLVSFLARDANDPGNNAYTILSCLVLFTTIAVKVRKRAQFERLIWAVAGVGTLVSLYGILQFAGVDPFGFGARDPGVANERVFSSFGNPIFFSSYLLLSTTLTLVAGVIIFNRYGPGSRGWTWLIAAVLASGIQFVAIWLTDSRGPLVGVVTGAFIFLFAVLLLQKDKGHRIRVGMLLALAFVAWLTNWVASANPLTNPFAVIGIVVCFLLALAIVAYEADAYSGGNRPWQIWKWRFNQGWPVWWYWALSVLGIALLAGYFFVYNNNSFIEDYVYIFPVTLVFAMLLSWRANGGKQVPGGAPTRRGRKGKPPSRRSLGVVFNNPLALRVSVAAISAAALSALVLLLLIGWTSSSDVLLGDSNLDRDFGTLTGSSDAQEDTTLRDELNFVSTRRIDTWLGAGELLISRDTIFEQNAALEAARHVFGYGQEMYPLAYPLTAPAQAGFEFVANPHNFLLLVWLEQGLWGIASFLVLLLLILGGLVRSFFSSLRANGGDYWVPLLASALLGLLGGRLLEQSTGVARISDLFLFWSILGFALALVFIAGQGGGRPQEAASEAASGDRRGQAKSRRRAKLGAIRLSAITEYGWRVAAPVYGFVAVTVLALILFIAVDVSAVYASARAAGGLRAIGEAGPTYNEEIRPEYLKIRDAGLDQPVSENYALQLTNLLAPYIAEYLKTEPQPNDIGFNLTMEERDAAARVLIDDSITALESNLEASPSGINSLVELTTIKTFLYEVEDTAGNTDEAAQLKEELLAQLEQILETLSSYPRNVALVANRYTALGNFEQSVATATQAIEGFEELGAFSDVAHYTRAAANYQLGNYEEAEKDFVIVLTDDPHNRTYSVQSVLLLSIIYGEQGNTELAGEFAELYNDLSSLVGQMPMNPPRRFLSRGRVQAALGNGELAVAELERSANHTTVVNEHSVGAAQELQEVLSTLGEQERSRCYGELALELERFLRETPVIVTDRPIAGEACAGS